MLMLLFTDIELCTVNNGFLSLFLFKGRGINQGCLASPLIYSYCGEILNHLIADSNVRGVPYDELRNVLSQFADDTSAFLHYDRVSINGFCETLQNIEVQMGLKVSYDKTVLYHVGSLYNSDAKLYTAKNFKWSNDPIETLGGHPTREWNPRPG